MKTNGMHEKYSLWFKSFKVKKNKKNSIAIKKILISAKINYFCRIIEYYTIILPK
jgi:hypothetical protein